MSQSAKTDAAFTLIKRDILNGSFLPDEPLRLPGLSASYGLSPTPLREALARLTEQGYVQSSANRGWRVAGVSVAQVEDLAHALLTVELQMLDDSISHGGIPWEAGIVAAHYRLAQVSPPLGPMDIEGRQRWIAAHDSFHAALVSGGRSDWLRRFRTQAADQLQRHHQAILFAPDAFDRQAGDAPRLPAQTARLLRRALSIPRHTALMNAVLRRDRPAARAALSAHVTTTLDAYRSMDKAKADRHNQTTDQQGEKWA